MNLSLEFRPLTSLSNQVDDFGFNRFDVQAWIAFRRVAVTPYIQAGRRQLMPPCVSVIAVLSRSIPPQTQPVSNRLLRNPNVYRSLVNTDDIQFR